MPTVVISVDGTDITDDVIIETASFTSQANGVPGTAVLRIKDVPHTREVITGKRMTVDIDGERAWTGYVMQVSRVYAHSATPTGPQHARLLQINGVDINILFLKRIVFNQADPTIIESPQYPDGTADTTVLNDLFDDWLYLTGDNLDTTTMIENVADINIDQEARPWSGSHQWGQVMSSIASLPGAVYYIDPDRRVVWTDVDTPNAPFALSDRPTGAEVGYRGMELLKDGSRLINDFLAIGFGYGDHEPVYSREQDATSISTHGRWQDAILSNGVYKQATIDRIAESVIYGSPSNKRGAKDDRVSVTLTVFQPGFRVGQKVSFESEVFGFTDVIPIRQQTITFINPTSPRYRMVLSHEIDPPWGFIDSFWPHLRDRAGRPPRDPRRRRRPRKPPEDGTDDLPGFPKHIGDSGDAGPPDDFAFYAALSTPVRGDAAGPNVWWIRGYATPIQMWEPFPPKEQDGDTYDGIRILWPNPMTLRVEGAIGAATVTAGPASTVVNVSLRHEGGADDGSEDEIVATEESGVSEGGLRFYGSTVFFSFENVNVAPGDMLRIQCGISGLVLIAGPSGRIGFFQPGWVRMYRSGWQHQPSDGETQDVFPGDGVTQTFETSQEFEAGSVTVTINGVRQHDFTADYQTNTVSFDFAPGPEDEININYFVEE